MGFFWGFGSLEDAHHQATERCSLCALVARRALQAWAVAMPVQVRGGDFCQWGVSMKCMYQVERTCADSLRMSLSPVSEVGELCLDRADQATSQRRGNIEAGMGIDNSINNSSLMAESLLSSPMCYMLCLRSVSSFPM